VPGKAEQAAVRKMMKEVFADQLADRSIAARRKLTAALMVQVEKSADAPTDQFVLLAAAVDAAEEGVDLAAACAAADRMAEIFDVDGLGVKAAAAIKMGPRSAIPDSAAANVESALELSRDLARENDYATAARVCGALQPAAARDVGLRTQLQQRQRELVIEREMAERFERDLARLKETPNDPSANLSAGRYACLVRGEWDGGLAMLAKGSDAKLKALASRELTRPNDPDDACAIGDAWWDLATKQADAPSRAAMSAHAATIYERAVDGMSGLRKAQVEKRLAEFAASNERSHTTELLARMQGKTSGTANGVVLLKPGDRIATAESFKPPIAFRMVVQTEGPDFRVAYACDQLIFNWELDPNQLRIDGGPASGRHKGGAGGVPQKVWVTIDLVVKKDSMTVSVNDEVRQTVQADFSEVSQKFSITSHRASLQVKSVKVSRPTN
jgi:hypothetical protein